MLVLGELYFIDYNSNIDKHTVFPTDVHVIPAGKALQKMNMIAVSHHCWDKKMTHRMRTLEKPSETIQDGKLWEIPTAQSI